MLHCDLYSDHYKQVIAYPERQSAISSLYHILRVLTSIFHIFIRDSLSDLSHNMSFIWFNICCRIFNSIITYQCVFTLICTICFSNPYFQHRMALRSYKLFAATVPLRVRRLHCKCSHAVLDSPVFEF
jgi:hypothetical protein